MEPGAVTNKADEELAGRAARGDLAAWHDFVLRYSGLIRSIVRRYHPRRTDDDHLTLYVAVLEYLYHEGLQRYDGRAALSTWVMTVTRSRVLDALRHEFGRRRPPRWLAGHPARERLIYQLHFVDFQPIPAILARLNRNGNRLTAPALEAILDKLEARMDRQLRRHLAYDREARSAGNPSGRLLETLDHLRLECEATAETYRPDHDLFQKQTRRVLEEIQACVRKLNAVDRQVIELRFYESLSAPGIARKLELSGPRRAHVLIDRALAALRGRLERRKNPPPTHSEWSGPLEEVSGRT